MKIDTGELVEFLLRFGIGLVALFFGSGFLWASVLMMVQGWQGLAQTLLNPMPILGVLLVLFIMLIGIFFLAAGSVWVHRQVCRERPRQHGLR